MEWIKGDVCACCALWIANRDDSGCDCRGGHDRTVMGEDKYVVTGEEPHFTNWQPCSACGSMDGGDRLEVDILLNG